MYRSTRSFEELPQHTLAALLARLYNGGDDGNTRKLIDAELSAIKPLPDWVHHRVLLSADVLSQIMKHMRVSDHASARVCRTWAVEWREVIRTWRLRLTVCPHADEQASCLFRVALSVVGKV